VHLRLILQQSRPVLLLEVLLLQLDFDNAAGVVDFGGRRINLGEEVEGYGVVGLFTLGVAGEGERGFLKVELDF